MKIKDIPFFNRPSYKLIKKGADTLSDLKKAYPNYFLDTKEFIIYLNKILNKYSEDNKSN